VIFIRAGNKLRGWTRNGRNRRAEAGACRWGRGAIYRQLAGPALIGMEATGNSHWLVDLLSELDHELCVGDAAQIRACYVRQQKTDKRTQRTF